MSHTRGSDGQNVLTLLPRDGQGLNLGLDDKLLHGITRLLHGAVSKAEWDLPLTLPTAGAIDAGGDEAVPRLLN
jgi:hypothetical protein